MSLETGDYVNDLVITNPTASDPVSQGDDQLRLIKKVVKQSFPSVDAAVNAIHTGASAPAVSITEGLVWVDTSGGAGNHLLKFYDGSSFITLAASPETANSVDVNAGTVDGAVIGGTTPAAITGTTLTGNTSLALATGATVTGIDDGTVGTGSATLLATQNAVKTYVDAQVTAQDLDVISDSGTIDIDLDSESLTVSGGSGLSTSATGSTLTIAGDDATTAAKGVASFSSSHFSVSSGAVSIATDGIDDTLIDFGTGTNQVSTADVPEETNLYYTDVRADARIAAADIGDLNNVDTAGVADDDILKYDSASGTFKVEADRIANHLTTKGDLLGFSTAEGRFPVGTDTYPLVANASATFGINYAQLATGGIADDAVSADKLADTAVSAGSYTLSSITVDAQGRLTSASSGTPGATAGFSVAMAIAL